VAYRAVARKRPRNKKGRQRPLLGGCPHATMEVLLEAMFSTWSAKRLYHATDRVQLSSISTVRSVQLSRVE
jgi:hypothetical protein